MSLTQEQIIAARRRLGISEEGVVSRENTAAKNVARRRQLAAEHDAKQKREQGGFQEFMQDVRETGRALGETVGGVREKMKGIAEAELAGEQGAARSFGQAFGTVAGGISRGIGDVVTGVGKAVLPESAEQKVVEKVGEAAQAIAPVASRIDEALGSPVGTFMENYEKLDPKAKRDVDSLLGVSGLAFDIATAGVTKKAAGAGVRATKKAAEGAGEVAARAAKRAPGVAKKATDDIAKLVVPEPKPVEAVGMVLQGEVKDIPKAVKTFAALDTKDVKTFADLDKTIKSKITDLAAVVDDDLARDTTKRTISELQQFVSTKRGLIPDNPVEKALDQLRELYQKTGDVVETGYIDDLVEQAKTVGLTNLEINDIERVYGSEFSKKAFNKIGDPLTSVNAQMFENTRKKLKKIARGGIKGTEAQAADETMSAMFNTQRLVQKNIKAVNKLRQKIKERGLLEKSGHGFAKYADILTGGTVRGLVGGLLPRGAGFKTLNALDLEELLSKNLRLIDDAIKSKKDDQIIKILKELDVN